MMENISAEQWMQYEEDGYLVLGHVAGDGPLATLQQRIDDIMLGRSETDYQRMLMQLDSEDGDYSHAGPQTNGRPDANEPGRDVPGHLRRRRPRSGGTDTRCRGLSRAFCHPASQPILTEEGT